MRETFSCSAWCTRWLCRRSTRKKAQDSTKRMPTWEFFQACRSKDGTWWHNVKTTTAGSACGAPKNPAFVSQTVTSLILDITLIDSWKFYEYYLTSYHKMCSSCPAFNLRKCTQSKWPEQACGPPPSMLQDLSTKKPTTQPEWSHSTIQSEKHDEFECDSWRSWIFHSFFLNLHSFNLFHFWKNSESWTTKQPAELPRKNGISKVLKSRQWIRQAMRLCTSLICWLETSCTRRNWERSHMSSHELHEIQVRSPKE